METQDTLYVRETGATSPLPVQKRSPAVREERTGHVASVALTEKHSGHHLSRQPPLHTGQLALQG